MQRYAAFVREMKGTIPILFLGALTISVTTTLGQICGVVRQLFRDNRDGCDFRGFGKDY